MARSLSQRCNMDHWFINPVSGMMLTINTVNVLVAVPGREILEYTHEEMEYVTLATPKPNPRVPFTYGGTLAGNPGR